MSNAVQVASFSKNALRASPSLTSLHSAGQASVGRPAGSQVSVGDGCAAHSMSSPTRKVSRKSTESWAVSWQEVKEVANPAAYMSIIVAMMGALMFGIDQGNYGLVQDFETFYDFWCKPHYMIDGYPCAPGVHEGIATPGGWTWFKSLGGSLITIGAAVGCVSVGPIVSSRCGRRPCVSLGGLVCFVGCLFASYQTYANVNVYYAGRFVTGFGAGICCFALPLYSSEVATPAIRGLMGSLFQFMVVVGGLLASLALSVITDWRLGMMLPGLAGALVATLIWFTPESPRYVMDRRGYVAGMETLQKVRKGNVENEAMEMHAQSPYQI